MKYIIAIIASMMVAGCSCNVGAGQPERKQDTRDAVVTAESDTGVLVDVTRH